MKAEDFDKAFDEGSDTIDQVIDWDKGVRHNLEVKRVNIDFPAWMIRELDFEARRLGVSRQSVIKTWVAGKLDESRLG